VRNILDRASCRDLRQQKGERCAAVPHLRRAALASFKAHHSGHDNDIKSSKDRWVKGQSVLEWYGVINLASLARCNHLRPLDGGMKITHNLSYMQCVDHVCVGLQGTGTIMQHHAVWRCESHTDMYGHVWTWAKMQASKC
jgi:hypothetical protein